jgi:hypothetical protein
LPFTEEDGKAFPEKRPVIRFGHLGVGRISSLIASGESSCWIGSSVEFGQTHHLIEKCNILPMSLIKRKKGLALTIWKACVLNPAD